MCLALEVSPCSGEAGSVVDPLFDILLLNHSFINAQKYNNYGSLYVKSLSKIVISVNVGESCDLIVILVEGFTSICHLFIFYMTDKMIPQKKHFLHHAF